MLKRSSEASGAHGGRGVALVAVLSVLTVLAVLAAVFATHTGLESSASDVELAKGDAEMLARSAQQHVLAHLRMDAYEQPAWDEREEAWSAEFRLGPGSTDGAEIDGLPGAGPEEPGADGRWIYVHDARGVLVGRYAALVEDEAGKINVNVASALTREMQNQGVDTFELLLTDGVEAGLPVSVTFGKNLLRYRYGRDGKPGQANVDDNYTASSYATDLIDNNANGVIDEVDEGIDEPEEYNPLAPAWDDRAFSSMREAGMVGMGGHEVMPGVYRALKRHGTVYSRGTQAMWDERGQRWRKQINVNQASRRQLDKVLRMANEETRFEASARNMRGLVGNVTDYRDENHVLTTMGSEYGVEGVCFNEVLANDGSFTVRAEANDPNDRRYVHVHRFGWWYLRPDKVTRFVDKDYGWKVQFVSAAERQTVKVVTNGVTVTMPMTAQVALEDEPVNTTPSSSFREFGRIRDDIGGWPVDLWKNALLYVLVGEQNNRALYMTYPIVGNTKNRLTVACESEGAYMLLSAQYQPNEATNEFTIYNRVRIDTGWIDTLGGLVGLYPRISDYFALPVKTHADFDPPKNLYYSLYIAEQNLPGEMEAPHNMPWKGFNPNLDVDGDASRYSETRMLELTQADLKGSTLQLPAGVERAWLLRWPYKNGEPVRAQRGFVHALVSTCKGTGYDGGPDRVSRSEAYANKVVVQDIHAMRPDIVELINISDHPVSLRNWRVVINTGSYADQVGLIDNAMEYSALRRSQYENANPMIQANGYFYLTNNRRIFDMDYGAPQDANWGTSASEGYPVYELPDALWGVRYKVGRVSGGKVKCEGAMWRKDQMKYEMTEWHLRRPRKDQNAPFGLRNTILGNTRDTLDFGQVNIISLKAGDDILILGMPREGGFLSMTLKNEYNQITARTVTYGSTRMQEIGYSTEKLDPTHYTWVKNPRPTFGGTERKARNHAFPRGAPVRPHVKNNRFVSVGELQLVRKAEDWQNIGMEKRGKASTRTLKALARHLTVSGVRLDPEEEGVHVSGWRKAYGVVRGAASGVVVAEQADWEPNVWANQTVRFFTGPMKGESFRVVSSTESGVKVAPYSTPGGKQLRVNRGDVFSVGPGYATPMFYTRKDNDEGIWEWKNKGLEKMRYGLYVWGLNDSITTTEFMEENHNAELEIAVYNYERREYDVMPLAGERRATDMDDPYTFTPGLVKQRYEKSDGVYCGMIRPEHISAQGGIRLRIVATGLNDRQCSGFAWFDYAYLTPARSNGKLNINTASERALRALPGVSKELARDIYTGTMSSGAAGLRPYKNVSEVLDVRGMSVEIFTKICNLITTRSDQYRVAVVAQALGDRNGDGKFDAATDVVRAEARREVIVDRSSLTDDDPLAGGFVEIQSN